jgi:hypothetical protein
MKCKPHILTQCHSAGRKAFQLGLERKHNPYRKTTLKYKAWKNGYVGDKRLQV